ncbi:MAG: GNAT family N-acetyltransferase [Lachnospiraceae bacterium]|jgi:ribosomal-protein-alanine N-acetyltransferase|nr:GNAT family N-acetyltransferase [Lachnospiraceae bacterium]
MLKGIIIAASDTGELQKTLTREGLALKRVKAKEERELLDALAELRACREEVLCLVETDEQEKLARTLGLFCVGYLNPKLPDEKLRGCRILLEGFQEIDRTFLQNVHTRALGLPVQIAETKRLLIREMTLSDLDEINALYREEPSATLSPELSLNRQEEEEKIRAYIAYMYGLYQFGMWVVIEKKSHEMIGRAGFGIADYLNFSEIDLGYLIGRKYRGQGYGEEACRAVLDYGSQVLYLPRVSAYIDRENKGSLHLIEKLGFQKKQSFAYEERTLCRYLLNLQQKTAV